jgi:hypothetical protein
VVHSDIPGASLRHTRVPLHRAGDHETSWLYGIVGTGSIVVTACYAAWFWSKIRIILDPERIRWPLKRKELRWDEIRSSTIVRRLGFTYVRVVTKDDRVIRIELNRPGGAEFRRRLLRRLELD